MAQMCVLEFFYTYVSIWEDKSWKDLFPKELDRWEMDLKFFTGHLSFE